MFLSVDITNCYKGVIMINEGTGMISPKLSTLIAVGQTLNITKAAEQLSLTQPAVSQHIKSLEQEFGVKLFTRGEHGMTPTVEGIIAIKYAERIQAIYTSLVVAIKEVGKNVRHLNIGITQTAEMSIISEVLAEYCTLNLGTHITVISDTITNLYKKIKTYEIDFAIVDGKMNQNNITSVLLATDSLVLVASPENPLAQKGAISLGELKKENLILRSKASDTRQLFESHLKSHNESPESFNVIMEIDSVNTIIDLVRRNFGVSVLAKSACRRELGKGSLRVVPIENLSMMREINVVYYSKNFDYQKIIGDITALYDARMNVR